MKILKNPYYMMDMSCAGDVWRLRGKVYFHPRFDNGSDISPSTPISLSSLGDGDYQMITASGSVYIVEKPSDDIIEQIKKDIARKGYEVR